MKEAQWVFYEVVKLVTRKKKIYRKYKNTVQVCYFERLPKPVFKMTELYLLNAELTLMLTLTIPNLISDPIPDCGSPSEWRPTPKARHMAYVKAACETQCGESNEDLKALVT